MNERIDQVKTLVYIICLGVLFYGIILMIFYLFQDRFLFFPGKTAFGDCPEMEKYNLTAQRFGNIRYYLQADPHPDRWIIIFHGNAGNACDRTYFPDLLKAFNANIVLFEYPGYGKDTNSPTQSLIIEQALELTLHIKGMNPDNLPVYLMGESLGTGVATITAAHTQVSGLILFSAYTSIAAVARHHYPWLPVNHVLKHKFQADIQAGRIQAPVILFHGTDDDIIPVQFARQQVLNFAGAKKLVELSGCGHNDILDSGQKRIQEEIKNFMLKKAFLY